MPASPAAFPAPSSLLGAPKQNAAREPSQTALGYLLFSKEKLKQRSVFLWFCYFSFGPVFPFFFFALLKEPPPAPKAEAARARSQQLRTRRLCQQPLGLPRGHGTVPKIGGGGCGNWRGQASFFFLNSASWVSLLAPRQFLSSTTPRRRRQGAGGRLADRWESCS